MYTKTKLILIFTLWNWCFWKFAELFPKLAELWLILPKTGRKGAAENIQKKLLIFSCDNCDKFDFLFCLFLVKSAKIRPEIFFSVAPFELFGRNFCLATLHISFWECGKWGGGKWGGVKRGGGWGAGDRGRPPPSQNWTSGRHMSRNLHRNPQFQRF